MTPSLNPWGLPSEDGSEKHFGRKAKKMREEERAKRRIDDLLRYYATTTTPVEKVAEYMGCTVAEARAGLREFGRLDV